MTRCLPVGNLSSLTFHHHLVMGMKVMTTILLLIPMQLLITTEEFILKITVTPILILLRIIPVTVGITLIATVCHRLPPLPHPIPLMSIPVAPNTMIPPLSITNQYMSSAKPTLIPTLLLSFLRDSMNTVDYLIDRLHAGHLFSERGMFL